MKNSVLKKEAHVPLSVRRYLALWLPYLPSERRSPSAAPDEPLVLLEKLRGALRLSAVDARAHSLGLRPGLALAEARARVPLLRVEDADEAGDRRLLLKLATLCERFSPLVALDHPHGLMLDITGCVHLFGGEETMRWRVARTLERLGFRVRATLAGTPDAARALCRFGDVAIVPAGQDEHAVAPLPLVALEASAEITTALTRAGFRTLGDLAARPPQILAARFGQTIVTRLARLTGRENTRITPLRPQAELVTERHFAEPLALMDSLAAVLAELCQEAVALMVEQGAGGRLFEASFFRSDGKVRRIAVETARATRDARSIVRLFSLRMDTVADPVDPGFGFDAVRLAVRRAEPLRERQRGLDGKVNDDTALAELIDRLTTRFGASRVLRFVARDTHDPLRVAAAVPVASMAASAEWELEEGRQRPLQLFNPPQPIEALAEVPDGPPRRFRWRKVLHDVAAAEGPERIAPEWWRDGTPDRPRDYYHVEDSNGYRFWIFREGLFEQDSAPRWFLHGLFA